MLLARDPAPFVSETKSLDPALRAARDDKRSVENRSVTTNVVEMSTNPSFYPAYNGFLMVSVTCLSLLRRATKDRNLHCKETKSWHGKARTTMALRHKKSEIC